MAKKTFKDLTVGDVFYELKADNTIVELICKGIVFDTGNFSIYFSKTLHRLDDSYLTAWEWYGIYVNKSDVLKKINDRQQKYLQQLYNDDIELNKKIQSTINNVIETSKQIHKALFNEKQI